MAVDFKTFVSLAPAVSAARLPVLLRGRHGIGKSQVVYQMAAEMGLPVIERRASQMTEGDLVGLPSIDGNVSEVGLIVKPGKYAGEWVVRFPSHGDFYMLPQNLEVVNERG